MKKTRLALSKVKRPDPETVGQAHAWDRNVSRYRSAGFCDRCASQASWGHQLGFANAKPVCEACEGLEVPVSSARAQRWAGDDTAVDA